MILNISKMCSIGLPVTDKLHIPVTQEAWQLHKQFGNLTVDSLR